jgi:hypothetical protein
LPLGVALFFAIVTASYSQQVQNVTARFDGEKVILSYDLLTSQPEDRFAVTLYSSHDNYQRPLSLVVGDAGENISPGTSHRITWDAKSSLPPEFNNEITFKVRASMMVSLHHPSRLKAKPLDNNTYKRKGVLNLEWNGGKEGELMQVDLYQDGQHVEKVEEVTNSHVYSWTIPPKTKPGSNYSLRISKAGDSDVYDNSATFKIAPRVPLAMKLIPVIVVGGVVAILAAPSKEEEPDLPGPVTPGG